MRYIGLMMIDFLLPLQGFCLSSGRLCRLLIEGIVAGIIVGILTFWMFDLAWLQLTVCIIAAAFLYEIWRIAYFTNVPYKEIIESLMKDEE